MGKTENCQFCRYQLHENNDKFTTVHYKFVNLRQILFMKSTRPVFSLITFCLLALVIWSSSCNKKCRSLQSTYGGAIVGAYDFKECFIYAQFDSTLVIASDTAFQNYKTAHFKNCTATLDAVDFSKNCIIGYKVKVLACNAAFHRNISIDTTAKTYTYTVSVETCSGCGQEIASPNIMLAPQIPAGYALKFVTKLP